MFADLTLKSVINYYSKEGSDWIDGPKPKKSHISDSKSISKKDFSVRSAKMYLN